MKLKRFCKAKYTISRKKWQPTDWEKFLTNPTSEYGLISKIYKEFKELGNKIPENPIKNEI